MHFVGNRAIVLGDGRKELQLYYNPGYTTLSVILPIVFLFFGFTVVEFRQPGQRFFWPFLLVSGLIAGLAITGMHYIGNLGISNYILRNPPRYIIGAAAVAIFASITALALFFYFKERWINSLPRRMICASVLACAVSGMHWLATVGTTYTLVKEKSNVSNQSRDSTLIVAIVIVRISLIIYLGFLLTIFFQSLLSCVVCFAFAFLTQRRKKQLADRAQHVVIASATFDQEGKLLVTQEGLIPSRKVTKQFNQKVFRALIDSY
jgi:NO-binding membrane sensor protein with MHYT domain